MLSNMSLVVIVMTLVCGCHKAGDSAPADRYSGRNNPHKKVENVDDEDADLTRGPIDVQKVIPTDWAKSKKSLVKVVGYCLYPSDPYTDEDVANVHIVRRFNLYGYGPVALVQGNLTDRFPISMPEGFCVLLSEQKKEAFVLWVDNARVIRCCSSDTSDFIGGTEVVVRRLGWFKCFFVADGRLKCMFTSQEPTSNYSWGNTTDGCANYVGGDLVLRNYDVDGDGYEDLEFSGIKRVYCTEDRLVDSDKPIRLEKIKFVYLYSRSVESKGLYIKSA
jgi:hypothetical protein